MIEITSENYKQEVIEYKGKVVIDCWANWCGVCKMMKPKFEELSNTHKDIKFCTLDVDKWPEFTEEMLIVNLPTFIIYEYGKPARMGSFEVLNTL